MANFPDLGTYRTHQGMFVGEVHDERETMSIFIKNLRNLAGKVDVLLLEYYPSGESPHLKWPEQIEKDLQSFKKTFSKGGEIAQQVYKLWAMAYYHGIAVRGIEVPTPKDSESGTEYLLWRMSEKCNQAFLDGADAYAKSVGSEGTRFCMYGGIVHAVKLKKLAPSMPRYRVTDGAIVEIR